MSSAGRKGLWDGKNADSYDAKWKRMAEAGQNPHGEADFVQRYEPQSVLDAGCGTGRVAIELAARGLDTAGTDINAEMLAEARAKAPDIVWTQTDLAELELDRTFDVVVLAGNVILFVDPGTEVACVAGAARHVAPGGRMIAGFMINRNVSVDDWETWLRQAGLAPEARFSTWDGDEFDDSGNYLVSVAVRPSEAVPGTASL